MDRVGLDLVSKMKDEVRASMAGGKVARKDFTSRDILSVLVRANMADDLPESNRLEDHEILAREY
jgi:hypothetical protein